MKIVGDIESKQELHRYINFEKYMDLISTKKIFLSKISSFEDHLEGSFTPVLSFMSKGGGKALASLVASIPSTDHSAQVIDNREEIEKELNEHDMSSIFKGFPYKDYGEQFEYIQKQHREWINAVCWHANDFESMAMWKIYGENDNAVCIITDVSKLQMSITAPQGVSLNLVKIKYINHREDEITEFNPLTPFMHKSKPYSFEKEYRLLAYRPNSKILEQRPINDTGILLDVNIGTLIKEIRVSQKSPEWFYKMVERFSKKYISENISVSRSTMVHKAIY